jgi:hypothetical protein
MGDLMLTSISPATIGRGAESLTPGAVMLAKSTI